MFSITPYEIVPFEDFLMTAHIGTNDYSAVLINYHEIIFHLKCHIQFSPQSYLENLERESLS